MVFNPDSISSEKPLSSASFCERLRKSGRTALLRLIAMNTEIGTVTMNTPRSGRDVSAMPTSVPTMVMIPVAACKISLDSEALTVSIS